MSQDFSAISTIFFDTSDTLYKNEDLENAYPQKLTEMVAREKGLSLENAKELLDKTAEKLKTTEKHVTKIRTAQELGFTPDEVYEKAFDKVVPEEYLTPDVQLVDYISRLAKGYKLGIISNLKKYHVLKVLKALGLKSNLFTYYVTLDVVQNIKPDIEPFLKAIELSGCSAYECLYVGDSPTKDMQPAKEVGMKTVLIAHNSSPENMRFSDAVISNVMEVLTLLP